MLCRTPILTATVLAALIGTAVPMSSASAEGSGSVSATVAVAPPVVRSVTISPSAINFGSCFDAADSPSPAGLAIPHGTCRTPDGTGTDAPITISNGAVASHIYVSAGDAVPADNGQHWTLCGTGATCTANGAPGADQYSLNLQAVGNTAEQPRLGTTPACDAVFQEASATPAAGCAADPNQTAHEWLRLTAPESTTSAASSFTTTVTWTAMP